MTRFTGCPARLTANAVCDEETGSWTLRIHNENQSHNLMCSEQIFYSYLNNSDIDDAVLFGRAASQISVDGNPRQIRNEISAAHGMPFKSSQYSNLKNYQLGGQQAADNFESLVQQLSSMEGARCVVLRERDRDMVRGLVFQTGMQRAHFQRYVDSLILDWTHNTNNLGFFLGSLLATSASGKGVPVLEFLCLSQGTAMLTSVLEFFAAGNLGALSKVKSFVIDKDLAEWAALKAVFPSAAVVLCQFHVIKWFKQCVSNPAYNIEPGDREATVTILRAMVYAPTETEFKRLKSLLCQLLNKDCHASFHRYIERRWYGMTDQWTDFRRGKVYTAGNTTSNRLESHWNQLKSGLGKKRRLDSCFLAIVLRGRAILSREYEEQVEFTGKMLWSR